MSRLVSRCVIRISRSEKCALLSGENQEERIRDGESNEPFFLSPHGCLKQP